MLSLEKMFQKDVSYTYLDSYESQQLTPPHQYLKPRHLQWV